MCRFLGADKVDYASVPVKQAGTSETIRFVSCFTLMHEEQTRQQMKPTTIHVTACELLASGKIAVRLNEVNRAAQGRHLDTVSSLCDDLNVNR